MCGVVFQIILGVVISSYLSIQIETKYTTVQDIIRHQTTNTRRNKMNINFKVLW